jgi:glycine/D-amino acid oxidase-like deaminating enzyme
VLKEAARVVGIGAGIVGCGIDDHLAQMGWRDLPIGDGGPLFRTEYPQVALASPCSGHGFKFASIGGEIRARISPPMRRRSTILPFSTYTTLLASPDDLFAERCTPRLGARHDIQTP